MVFDVNHQNTNIAVAAGTGETMFAFLCSMLWPFIDSYYVAALALFSLFPSSKIPKNDLALRMQWLAEALYHDRKIQHYESCSLDTLKNAMRTFERMGVIGPAPNDPSPIGIDANELDPTKMPYSPDMIQLMPKYREKGTLQAFIKNIEKLKKNSSLSLSGDEAMMAATTMAELPMIGKARL